MADTYVHAQNRRTGAETLCGSGVLNKYLGNPADVDCADCLEVLAAAGLVRLKPFSMPGDKAISVGVLAPIVNHELVRE